jgi:hypothetical protein
MIKQRNLLNFVIDALTLGVALGLVATGLMMRFILPPGSARQGWIVWGWDRHAWGDVHFWLSMAAIGLVVVHLFLHWPWVCTTIGRMFTGSGHGAPTRGRRIVGGIAALVLCVGLVGGFMMLASMNVTNSTTAAAEHEAIDAGGGGGRGFRGGRGMVE